MTKITPPKPTLARRLLLCLTLGAAQVASAQQDLSAPAGWTLHPSHEAVKATLEQAKGSGDQQGFTLLYNFTAGSGFIIARHEFGAGGIDLPENYEFSFTLSGAGPSNNLEVKLLDSPDGKGSKLGDSVWWINRRNFEWPESPTRINNKAKQFQFAWGPLSGAKIKKLGAIEVVVASSSGGQGTITLTDLRFRPLPAPAPYTGRPSAAASSEAPGHPPALAIDGDRKTSWSDDDNTAATLTVDFKQPRDLDALRIDWATPVRSYAVESSDEGTSWQTIWAATEGGPAVARSYADIPDTTTRFLRISVPKTSSAANGIAEVAFLNQRDGGSSDNLGIWRLIAADLPPEAMPRYFTGRQSTWTVLGSPGGPDETLINEEGDVELFHSGPMVAAVVLPEGGKAVRWTGSTQRMDLDGVPTAMVERTSDRLTLAIAAFSTDSESLVRYTLTCNKEPLLGRLALCIRPFQVDPPWQFLNAPGGIAKVRSIEQVRDEVVINGDRRLALPEGRTGFAALGFDQGEAASLLSDTPLLAETSNSVIDPHNAASAAAFYSFDLRAGESKSWLMRIQYAPFPRAEGCRTRLSVGDRRCPFRQRPQPRAGKVDGPRRFSPQAPSRERAACCLGPCQPCVHPHQPGCPRLPARFTLLRAIVDT